MGVTWEKPQTIRAFSRYASELTPPAEGMIATVWFYLRRKQWETVESIIRISGDAYWYAN